jgi:hypothetical protein
LQQEKLMSKSLTLTIPDEVYEAIVQAANTEGESSQEWIISQLPTVKGNGSHPQQSAPQQPKQESLADVARRLGSIDTGRPSDNSLRAKELFGEYLEQKRREGHL